MDDESRMKTDFFDGELELIGEPTVNKWVDLRFSFRADLLLLFENATVIIKMFPKNVEIVNSSWEFTDLPPERQEVHSSFKVIDEGAWSLRVYIENRLESGHKDYKVYYVSGYSDNEKAVFEYAPPTREGLEDVATEL
ncbi:MAG: hypothetical protein ABIH90_01710 [Candidatus Aenigmatarchaeota archaeon]